MSRQPPTLRECLRHPAVLGLVILSFLLMLCMVAVSVVGYVKTSAALRQAEDRYRQAQETVDKLARKVEDDKALRGVEDGDGKPDDERKKEE